MRGRKVCPDNVLTGRIKNRTDVRNGHCKPALAGFLIGFYFGLFLPVYILLLFFPKINAKITAKRSGYFKFEYVGDRSKDEDISD